MALPGNQAFADVKMELTWCGNWVELLVQFPVADTIELPVADASGSLG